MALNCKQLAAIEASVEKWIEDTNNYGIWLFLGAVGCLGIPQHPVRLYSFVFLGIIYISSLLRQVFRLDKIFIKFKSLDDQVDAGSQTWFMYERISDDCVDIWNILNRCWVAGISSAFFIYSCRFALN